MLPICVGALRPPSLPSNNIPQSNLNGARRALQGPFVENPIRRAGDTALSKRLQLVACLKRVKLEDRSCPMWRICCCLHMLVIAAPHLPNPEPLHPSKSPTTEGGDREGEEGSTHNTTTTHEERRRKRAAATAGGRSNICGHHLVFVKRLTD